MQMLLGCQSETHDFLDRFIEFAAPDSFCFHGYSPWMSFFRLRSMLVMEDVTCASLTIAVLTFVSKNLQWEWRRVNATISISGRLSFMEDTAALKCELTWRENFKVIFTLIMLRPLPPNSKNIPWTLKKNWVLKQIFWKQLLAQLIKDKNSLGSVLARSISISSQSHACGFDLIAPLCTLSAHYFPANSQLISHPHPLLSTGRVFLSPLCFCSTYQPQANPLVFPAQQVLFFLEKFNLKEAWVIN